MDNRVGFDEQGGGYWDSRAKESYVYRGERFYTITAVPLYVRRRTELLKLLHSYIDVNAKPKMRVLDFGCGDGWYLQYFASTFPQHLYYGTDISEEMIQLARQQPLYAKEPLNNSSIYKAFHAESLGEDIPYSVAFDCVYSVTVFAHIMESEAVVRSLKSICNHMTDDGVMLLFEQTGPVCKKGTTYIKRTVSDYTDLVRQAGLQVLATKHMTFPAHRIFETKIAPYIYRILAAFNRFREPLLSSDPLPVEIRANKSRIYRAVSKGLLKLTSDPYARSFGKSEGYTFFVLGKNKIIESAD